MKKIDKQLQKLALFNKLLNDQGSKNIFGPLDRFFQAGIAEQKNQNKLLDLSWYRTYYDDVGETDIDALTHYVLHGKKEGRFQSESEREASTTFLKIAVVVHVYYLDMVEDILEYVSNIDYDYTLFCTVSADKRERLLDILEKKAVPAEIIIHDNTGYYILHTPDTFVQPAVLFSYTQSELIRTISRFGFVQFD